MLIELMAIVSLILTLYALYLNWVQAKVDKKMDNLISEVKALHETLKQLKVR
jgi:hypothetical protein